MTYLEYIIPAVALIIVQIIISAKQQRVQDVRFEMTIKEIRDDIQRLEKKQDAHNNLLERVVMLEANDKAQWKYIDAFKEDLHGHE